MVWRFFAFPIKRGGPFATFLIFACAHEMAGWQWSRRGVTFPTFTFDVEGWKLGSLFGNKCSRHGAGFGGRRPRWGGTFQI